MPSTPFQIPIQVGMGGEDGGAAPDQPSNNIPIAVRQAELRMQNPPPSTINPTTVERSWQQN